MTMGIAAKNMFITGLPGSGKTTFVKKLSHELREFGPVGFITEEIREHGSRKGFKLTTLDETRSGVLAHVDISGPYRVGKYGVDLEGFEKFLGNLHLPGPSARLVIFDEIGKMECLSVKFRSLVLSLLGMPVPVIATIALKAGGFIDEVKHRTDVLLYEINEKNREALILHIAEIARSLPISR